MSGLVTLLTTKASGASSLLHGHRAKLATRLGCQGKLDSCPEWLLTLTPDQHITIFHCPHVSVAFDQTNCLNTRKQLIPTDTHQTAPLEHTWLKHGGEEGDWMASANSAKIQETDSIIIKEEWGKGGKLAFRRLLGTTMTPALSWYLSWYINQFKDPPKSCPNPHRLIQSCAPKS